MPTDFSQRPLSASPGVCSSSSMMMIQHKCLPFDTWKRHTHHEQTHHLSLQPNPSRPNFANLKVSFAQICSFSPPTKALPLLGKSIRGLCMYCRGCDGKLLQPPWNEDSFKAPCSRRKNFTCKNYKVWQAAPQSVREFRPRSCFAVDINSGVTACCMVQCAQGKDKQIFLWQS